MLKVSLTVGLEVGQSDRHHAKHNTFKNIYIIMFVCL